VGTIVNDSYKAIPDLSAERNTDLAGALAPTLASISVIRCLVGLKQLADQVAPRSNESNRSWRAASTQV
jgi:hypothetical protein